MQTRNLLRPSPDLHSSSRNPTMELEILQPTGLERRAAYMLLPEIKPNSFWNYFLLAKDPKSKRILGAAASCPGRNEQGLPRLHTRLHVPPPYRRQGVGRKLIESLCTYGKERQFTELTAKSNTVSEPTASPFLSACGFLRVDSYREYETTTEKLANYVLPLRNWLRERNEIPIEARIIPLAQAPLEQVASLHSNELAGEYNEVLKNLRTICTQSHAQDNAVLMLDSQVIGLLMGTTSNHITTIEASIIAPQYRGSSHQPGWANLALMAERIEWAIQLGSKLCRFGSLQAATPTQKLAKRTEATLVKESDFFALPLN